MGTNRQRVARLVILTGVRLEPIGTALVMDDRSFAKVKAAHARMPYGRGGRRPRPSPG